MYQYQLESWAAEAETPRLPAGAGAVTSPSIGVAEVVSAALFVGTLAAFLMAVLP